jgi:hypothetical protein
MRYRLKREVDPVTGEPIKYTKKNKNKNKGL